MMGKLIISLDFEMMWGVKDFATPEDYGKSNIYTVPCVIERLLNLFTKYGVHATFATVGFIFLKNKEVLLKSLPQKQPSYIDKNLSPYTDNYIENIKPEYEQLYFAPNLIRLISNTPGMEIATHTASHYNCFAPGQTLEEFEEDLNTAKKIAEQEGYEIKSIVFPKNEVDGEYLKVCEDKGIYIYRGNAQKFFGKTRGTLSRIFKRICRLADNYIPIDHATTYPLSEIKNGSYYNVRASRFLRPYSSKLSFLEGLRLNRIKKEITKAAKRGEVYHLWWHPHNFGANTEKNLSFLEEILKHFQYCKDKYGMESVNIQEVVKFVEKNNG